MSTHEHTPQTFLLRLATLGEEWPTTSKSHAYEVLKICDKNYHQLLPLIAEKMQKEKEQQDKLNATPTARTEPKRRHGNRRSQVPENTRLPVSSKDSNKTDLLYLGPGRERGVVCSIGLDEKNEVHLHVLTAAIRVPTKRKSRCNQGSIIIGARRPGKLADIQRVKNVMEVTGSPNQEDTGQTPTKMISLSLGRVRKETLSNLVTGISIPKDKEAHDVKNI
ncbi:hypothetical protein Tco_1155596 [Tanacetum coccineum]